jgi:mannose-6-phosphate isomerase-like protein (cupin superfamily)
VHLVHPRDVPAEPSDGGDFRTLLPPEVGGSLAIYLLSVTRSESHVHEQEDQVYIVQRGQGIVEVDGERRKVGPGDLVYIPRGAWHCLESLDAEPVSLYSLIRSGV